MIYHWSLLVSFFLFNFYFILQNSMFFCWEDKDVHWSDRLIFNFIFIYCVRWHHLLYHIINHWCWVIISIFSGFYFSTTVTQTVGFVNCANGSEGKWERMDDDSGLGEKYVIFHRFYAASTAAGREEKVHKTVINAICIIKRPFTTAFTQSSFCADHHGTRYTCSWCCDELWATLDTLSVCIVQLNMTSHAMVWNDILAMTALQSAGSPDPDRCSCL